MDYRSAKLLEGHVLIGALLDVCSRCVVIYDFNDRTSDIKKSTVDRLYPALHINAVVIQA